jgi:hypothetical protein
MGAARSGTTIVEIMLASAPQVFGAGELTFLNADAFLRDQPCSCGQPASRCEVWSRVLARCGWSRADVERFAELRGHVDAHRQFWKVALFWGSSRAHAAYAEMSAALVQAVAEVTGASVIIDSSKYAGRALALARALPGRVQVLWMRRTTRAIIAAFQKQNTDEQYPKGAWTAALYCLYVQLCARWVELRLGTAVRRLDYEALQADPVAEMGALEPWSGLDLARARAILAAHGAFDPGHIVTGNRVRRARAVTFQRADESANVRASLSVRMAAGVADFLGRVLGL